ncbi:polysaccharide export protein EpsE [Paucibacter sp. B2R-40]|uniref:polysaccharide export protein EpsE n=1 Tax=Paucibacter sp. B2R-40 TaxID=2893554 RepID=UPI0021E46EAF|nr:polysaccharide export protein EpsE [Paucibacter sp. B2R-40]MCV2357153.1 polysaccharide export protein EpsE [Paucibacter sp. B2R-40]
MTSKRNNNHERTMTMAKLATKQTLLACALMGAQALMMTPAFAQASAAAPAASAEYRLGAGDVMRVSVYQNPDLTLETRVSENNVVSFPLLGSIKVGGLSVTQAEQLITDGLKKGNFVKNPQVTIVVLQVKGNQASVLGQVNRPGRYPIETADMRLTDLIANAGGVLTGAGSETLVLTGKREGKPYRLEIDLPGIFAVGGGAQDVFIQHGDVVWVDRAPMVYIYGEVQRPGPMRLERGMTLMQSLATGGGITQRGTEKGIRVHRKNADGKVEIIQLPMDESLKDGDVVYVKESLF